MSTASNAALGCLAIRCLVLTGCASPKAAVEPPAETVTPPPVADQASIQAMGPPPDYVAPTNYWVREKIILTSEAAPPPSATQKSAVKKGKKTKKTG
jgi:hypothetical protein